MLKTVNTHSKVFAISVSLAKRNLFSQGSILGHLFFIIYVNDLYDASRLESILFADDTNLFNSEKDPVTLNNTLNSELDKL